MTNSRKYRIMMVIGILLIALGNVARFLQLRDFIQGAIAGVGIGMMILALLMRKRKVSC